MAVSPEIDYRFIIEQHMQEKRDLLEDHEMPYKERCAWINFHDTISLEWRIIKRTSEMDTEQARGGPRSWKYK